MMNKFFDYLVSYFVTLSYIVFHCGYKRNMKIDKIKKNETGNMKNIPGTLIASIRLIHSSPYDSSSSGGVL